MTHDDLARDLQSLREMAREASNAFEDVAVQEHLHRKLTQNLDTIIEALRSFSGEGEGSGVVEVDGVRYGPRMVRHMREQIESLTALKTAPDGWRLVPVEPTIEMMRVGKSAWFQPNGSFGDVYRAMISASPIPGEE